jgi:hypothetical protein
MAAQRPGGMAQIASQAITSLPYALPEAALAAVLA